MSLSKSRCSYSNHSLHFTKRAVPLPHSSKFKGSNPAPAGTGREKIEERSILDLMRLQIIEKIFLIDQVKLTKLQS